MCAFISTALGFIILGKCNEAPLYLIVHVCMWSTTACKFNKIRALLAHCCCQPLRWTTALCMVPNLEHNAHMAVLRDDTSSSITFFNYSRVDVVTSSLPCLVVCNSLAIRSFSVIKKRTLELVASAYALVALANAIGFFFTSDTITHSLNCAGDVWSSGVDTLRDCKTLWCDSSNDILCIYSSRLSPRFSVSPWLLRTCSASGSGEASGSTSWW